MRCTLTLQIQQTTRTNIAERERLLIPLWRYKQIIHRSGRRHVSFFQNCAIYDNMNKFYNALSDI
jgi:hypothetical protein